MPYAQKIAVVVPAVVISHQTYALELGILTTVAFAVALALQIRFKPYAADRYDEAASELSSESFKIRFNQSYPFHS